MKVEDLLPAVKLMRSILQHNVHQRGLGEGHETEAPRAARFAVLHDHAVDDVTVA